jgi:hypothetical protein
MDGLRTCARIQLTALLRCRGRVATSTAGNAVFLLCEARLYTSPSLPSPPTECAVIEDDSHALSAWVSRFDSCRGDHRNNGVRVRVPHMVELVNLRPPAPHGGGRGSGVKVGCPGPDSNRQPNALQFSGTAPFLFAPASSFSGFREPILFLCFPYALIQSRAARRVGVANP